MHVKLEYEKYIKMSNKISKVELLRDFLRKGEFKKDETHI